MFNISSLKPREKFLLLIMMSLIAFILIFFIANNAFSRLVSSQDKLTSIQSDYEHVLKRYQQIERSINTEISQDKTRLLEALKTYIATTNVNLNTIDIIESNLVLKVTSPDIDNSIQFINNIGSKYNLKISSIELQREGQKIGLKLVLKTQLDVFL